MQMLLRSRYLSVKKEKSEYYITGLASGRCIRSGCALIDLIDRFNKPRSPVEIESGYDREEFVSAIERLQAIGFLVAGDAIEEKAILREWRNRIPHFSRYRSAACDSPFILYGGNRDFAGAARFSETTASIPNEISVRLFPFKRKIYTVLLSRADYEKITAEYRIPKRTMAFVDTKSVLVLNAEHLDAWMKNAWRFRSSIKHELIHILLGQWHYYIPAWIEEGICEIYSGQKDIRITEALLRKRKKTYTFSEAESLITRSIMDIDDSPITRNTVYAQASSFVRYLIAAVGEKAFWNVIENTGICVNFREIFYRTTNHDVAELEKDWAASIA